MKVVVRIHTDHGLEIKTKKVLRDNKLKLRKKPEWIPTLKGFETKNLAFGRVRYFTDIWEGAPETWSYQKGITPQEQPELTQEEVTKFAKANIFHRRYAEGEEKHGQAIFYIILLAVVALGIVQILISTGRLRI